MSDTRADFPGHGFERAEFEGRLVRAQAAMRAAELDGFFVTQPANIRYFSGLDTQFWESPTRPWFLVLPADGPITAVVPEIGVPGFAATWVNNVRSWPAPMPSDDGVTLLVGTLAALPRRFGRIGAELGREQSLRMPATDFLRIAGELRSQGIEIGDATPLIWGLRMVKSEAEIARIGRACQVASRAYARVPEIVRPGMTEREAARALRIELLAQGADTVPFLPAISGPSGVAQIVCGPGDRVIGEGDMVFFDTGATYDGYFCDFDRNYAVGALPDDALRAQERVWQATEAGIAAARPGATAADVFLAMAGVLGGTEPSGGNVGRLGHGLGLQLTEPPSHMPGDDTELVPGMVLTIEPGLEYAPGKMIVHEENIVVRDGAPELLTERAPRTLPVIG